MKTKTSPELSTLTLTELLELMPEGADWTIVDSTRARVTGADGRPGMIYWDAADPANAGWAYQQPETATDPEESGELNDADDLDNIFG